MSFSTTRREQNELIRRHMRRLAKECVASFIAAPVSQLPVHLLFDHLSVQATTADLLAHPDFLIHASMFIYNKPNEELKLVGLKAYNLSQKQAGSEESILPPEGMNLNRKKLWSIFLGLYQSWLIRTNPEKADAILAPYSS